MTNTFKISKWHTTAINLIIWLKLDKRQLLLHDLHERLKSHRFLKNLKSANQERDSESNYMCAWWMYLLISDCKRFENSLLMVTHQCHLDRYILNSWCTAASCMCLLHLVPKMVTESNTTVPQPRKKEKKKRNGQLKTSAIPENVVGSWNILFNV